jgi:hypothetical protein
MKRLICLVLSLVLVVMFTFTVGCKKAEEEAKPAPEEAVPAPEEPAPAPEEAPPAEEKEAPGY